MSENISLREFGRQIGMSVEGVRKAIKQGRIPAAAIGETTLKTGRKRPCIADTEKAAKALNRNTDHSMKRVPNSEISAAKKRAAATGTEQRPADDESSRLPSITSSKQLKEVYLARLAKLEFDEKNGRLVNAEHLKIEMTNMITAAKSKLLGVPSKAKGQLTHLTVSDIEYFEELISEALEDIAIGS